MDLVPVHTYTNAIGCVHFGKEVYAFTKDQDEKTQAFALSLGASWAGGSQTVLSEPLDAAIIFAPDGRLVPLALQNVKKRRHSCLCRGIHMSDIPTFPLQYTLGRATLVFGCESDAS